LKDLKKRELIEQFEKILMVIFFSSGQSVYFNQFFLLKIHSDAELATHAHKLDMKLQSLCRNGFSLFAVRMLAKPYTT